MTAKSKICKFLFLHPETWEEELLAMGIRVRREDSLAIFNYDMLMPEVTIDFSNPIVQEARGIIIDVDTLTVKCWPFRKFGNWQESYADEIDWKNVKVTGKMDGSIIKLWHDDKKGWRFSTNAAITPEKEFPSLIQKALMAALEKSKMTPQAFYEQLNPDETYIFELTAPNNQVVIHYDQTKFWHIGTRNNVTGQETDVWEKSLTGIDVPPLFLFSSGDAIDLSACVQKANSLNKDREDVKYEGFVVVDGNFNRIKVKTPEYIAYHKMATRHLSKQTALMMILESPEKIPDLLKKIPAIRAPFQFYLWQWQELICQTQDYMDYARNLYEEFGHDRKALSSQIHDHPLSFFAFQGLQSESIQAENLLRKALPAKILKLMDDYEPFALSFQKRLNGKEKQEIQKPKEMEEDSFLKDRSI